MTHSKLTNITLLLMVGSVFASCSVFPQTSQNGSPAKESLPSVITIQNPTPASSPEAATLTPVQATPTTSILPTESPAPLPTATAQATQDLSSCGDLRFVAAINLFQGFECQIVPPSNSADQPSWELGSSYTKVNLKNYALANMFHQPVIYLIPLDELNQDDPQMAATASLLQSIVTGVTPLDSLEVLPLLPPFNAGEMFHVKAGKLDFKNGSGIRFITAYTQSIARVTNDILIYVFEGITSDGKSLVTVILPIKNSALPAPDNSAVDQQFVDGYSVYLANIRRTLDSAVGDAYSPTIEELDKFVTGIEVKKP